MNTPRPEWITSRLNAGGYGLRVIRRIAHWEDDDEAARLTPPSDGSPPDYWGKWGSRKATLTPDGSFMVEPYAWAARHYRRAIMRGAGVYRLELWAMLGPGRKGAQADPTQIEHRAVRGVKPNAAPAFLTWSSPSYMRPYVQTWSHSLREKPSPKPLIWQHWKAKNWGTRALDTWLVKSGPFYSHLIRKRGLWGQITYFEKSCKPVATPKTDRIGEHIAQLLNSMQKLNVITLPATNLIDAYKSLLGGNLNCIRSSSPRWCGTARHFAEKEKLIGKTVLQFLFPQQSERCTRASRTPRALAEVYAREVQRAGGAYAWAENMTRLIQESKGATALKRDVNKRLRSFAVFFRPLLTQILTALRKIRGNNTSHALAAFIALVRAAYIEACKLGRFTKPRRPARAPRPLYSRAIPPAAPLAPPAL